jgi:hypothetical protein
MFARPQTSAGVIRGLVPARVDRLPWSPFHSSMVAALGIAWILDGLEITIAGTLRAAAPSREQ